MNNDDSQEGHRQSRQRSRKIRMASRQMFAASSCSSSSTSIRHPIGLGGTCLMMLLMLLGVGVVSSHLGIVADAAHDSNEIIDHGRRQLRLALIDFTLSFESLHTPSLPELGIQDLQESIKVVLERELSAATFKMTPTSTTTTKIEVISMDLYTISQSSQVVNKVIKVDNTSWYDVQVSTDLILQYNFEGETNVGTVGADAATNNLSNGNIIRTILDQQSSDLLQLLVLLDEKYWGTVDAIRLIPSSTTTGGHDDDYGGHDDGDDDDDDATGDNGDSRNSQNPNVPWWSNSLFIFSVAGIGAVSICLALGVVVWYTGFGNRYCHRRPEQSTQQKAEAGDIDPIAIKHESLSETSSSEEGTTTARSDNDMVRSSTTTSSSSSGGTSSKQVMSKKMQPLEKLFSSSSNSTVNAFHGKPTNTSKIQAVYSEDKVCDTEVLNGLRSKRESAEDKLKSSMEHISVPTSITQKHRRHTLLSSRTTQTQPDGDNKEQDSTSRCQSIPSTNNSNAYGKSQIIDLMQKRKAIEERIKQKCKTLSDINNGTTGSRYDTYRTQQQQQHYQIHTVDQRRDTDSISTLTVPYGIDDGGTGGRSDHGGGRSDSSGVRFVLDQYKIDDDDDDEEDVELTVLSSDEEDNNILSLKTESKRNNSKHDRRSFDYSNDNDDDDDDDIAKRGLGTSKRSRSDGEKITKMRTRKSRRRRKDDFDDIPAVVHRTNTHHRTTRLPALDESYLSTFKKAYY